MGLGNVIFAVCAGLCLFVAWTLLAVVFGFQGNPADTQLMGGLIAVIFAVIILIFRVRKH